MIKLPSPPIRSARVQKFRSSGRGRIAVWTAVASLGLSLTGCLSPPSSTRETPAPPLNSSASPAANATPSVTSLAPTRTTRPTATPVPDPGATAPGNRVCSPLPGVALADLRARVTNPFHPPTAPGSDLPHQGVDFASRDPALGVAAAGDPVAAVLNGRVAAVITDRFPYGNAILIETFTELLPEGWLDRLNLPVPAPTLEAGPALTCPAPDRPAEWDPSTRSLYLLYAHLQDSPGVAPGERVACGAILGAIGDSGNALNPHLHLEARIGPAGARFEGMAHYTTSATKAEMGGYCVWRVSGWFRLLDPLQLLESLAREEE